jgi:adenylate cyclase
MKRVLQFLTKVSAYRLSVYVGLVFAFLLLIVHGRLDHVPVVGRVEHIFHDMKFKLERGVRQPAGDVVVAAVDEKAISTIGRWQFPRQVMGVLVDKLTALGAKAIVFDVVYSDAATEGDVSTARKLKQQFDPVSLAGQEATDALAKLTQAQTEIAGTPESAARLAPLAQTLSDSLATLAKYKGLQADFQATLAKEAGGVNGDEAFGAAVHRSGRVVLGSFLMTPAEAEAITPAVRKSALKALGHARIPAPTVAPQDDNAEIVREEPVQGPLDIHTYSAAKEPFSVLLRAEGKTPATSVAFFNTVPDIDGVIRREPLVMEVLDEHGESYLFPSLEMGGVLKYYDADPGQMRLWSEDENGKHLEWIGLLKGSAKGVPGAIRKKDFTTIQVDSEGQLLLNYYGPDRTFPNISLADVWTDAVDRKQIDGKIVLVGVTAQGTYDQRVTPFAQSSPGVEIHATAMENMLHHEYLVRPWWALPFECLLVLVIAFGFGRFLPSIPVLHTIWVTILMMGAYHAFDYSMFRAGISLFSAYPLAEVLMIFVTQTLYRYTGEERAKRETRRAFQHYLSKDVIDEVLKDPTKLKLGGVKKDLTVLFSDIRGFTTISEKLTPEQLASLINEYLTPMTNIVFDKGGTLDKYIGDALMAIFGAPVEQPDNAYRCCSAAVTMMRELDKLQARWKAENKGYPPIDIGIGINSGPMVVGNMGADQRFDYTVLGDNVNLASRLEGTNKEYKSHVIISEATLTRCNGMVAARELGAVKVKGKNEPVKIYELMDDKPPTGELAEIIRRFNQGIAHFKKQEWQLARQTFDSVLEMWPKDGPAHAYLDFVAEMEANPPGPDWDGVYTMTHK